MRHFIPTGLLAILLSTTASGARAQSVADTLGRWGLLGWWQVDCAAPPSVPNIVYNYVRRDDGSAYLFRDAGDNRRDTSELPTAVVDVEGRLTVLILFKELNQSREHVYLKGPGGRFRVLTNRMVGGDHSVRDGKFTADGNTTPWLTRCR